MSNPKPYVHELPDFAKLIQVVSGQKRILPQLVEKDYWIMHSLHGLQQQGFVFELKGGTSLSKGYRIIDRFSEDIDIRIEPPEDLNVKYGRNQNSPAQVRSRQEFFGWLAGRIQISGIQEVVRDTEFDDKDKFRGAGIRLIYPSNFPPAGNLKSGILLEVGFDDTTPNEAIDISSWAFETALAANVQLRDNRAPAVKCYHPGYTFVEKLQAVSTKFRQQQQAGVFHVNFLRHYYDLYCLLDHPLVQDYIGTDLYQERKGQRFRREDNLRIAENDAFILADPSVRTLYEVEYKKTRGLYYSDPVPFSSILERFRVNMDRL